MSRAVTVIGGPSVLRQAISVGPHHLIADEPKTSGGSDAGPDPYELLLSALGSCTNMTLQMYADRKKWPLKEIRVALTHSKNYANDCVNWVVGQFDFHRQLRLVIGGKRENP